MTTITNLPRFIPHPLEPPYYTIKCLPSNREEKRLFMRETDKIADLLFEVEAKFLFALFNDNGYSYMDLFTHFNNVYKDVYNSAKVLHGRKLRFIELNQIEYFYKEYYPKENEKVNEK